MDSVDSVHFRGMAPEFHRKILRCPCLFLLRGALRGITHVSCILLTGFATVGRGRSIFVVKRYPERAEGKMELTGKTDDVLN